MDMIQEYKIMHGMDKMDKKNNFSPSQSTITKGHQMKFSPRRI